MQWRGGDKGVIDVEVLNMKGEKKFPGRGKSNP